MALQAVERTRHIALFAQGNHLHFYALLPAMTEFTKALSARFGSSVVVNELEQEASRQWHFLIP